MKKYIVFLAGGQTIPVEADYFKIIDGEVHFFINAEKVEDIYVSSTGTIVVPEEKVKKEIKGFE